MAAEIGSSVGNNQAALEEQRKKQQEEAAKKAQETSASSDTAAAEKTSENSKQTDTGNKENPLSIQRPGATDTSQTNETSNKLETDPSKISAKLSDSSKISDNLSTSDLIVNIAEKIEKTQARIDANPFNKSNNPNSTAEHIATRPDTLAFAAQQVRIETSRNREEQVRLEDDRHSHAAYQEVKSHAEKLIKDGKENEAKELLRQVIGKPETVRSVAEEVIAQRLSPQTINLKFSTNLDAGRSEPVTEMQANLHVQMTKEEHQDHTLELMNGLMEDLDESAQTFIRNEEMLDALINPKKQDSREALNPFSSSTQKTNNPFELKNNLPSSSETTKFSEDGFSMLHRLGLRPNPELIQKEIEHREALKETLIQQREVQLRAQANLTKLAQSGKADQIHLLFDGKGNPLDTETLKDRGSYNSGLPDELESRYRELNDFLKKDPSFESSFTTMQDSLIGLSPEEQTVRARDFLTENLHTQRETLRLLQGINPDLNSIINDKNSSAMESLIAIDQRTISKLTQETLSRRTDLMIELHDQLTENLNSGNFQKAAIAIEKTQKDLEDGIYTYRNNKLSDYELVNRDLARTPKEDKEIQQRISALEEKFEALADDQLNIVRGNMSNIDDHLKEFKSLNESVPLGLFEEKGWRVIGGEANIRLESIESLQNHSDRVLNNLLSQQKNIENANESMTQAKQLERYERKLEEIINQTSSNYQGAGAQAFRDGENIRRNLEGLDNFYGNTESGLKLARNAAIIAGVTLATGGTATGLVASGWGITGAGLGAFGVGTAYGAGVSLLANSAEGLSRDINGFNNPYEKVLSQTWQDTKTSASVAAATATGASLTRALSETYKWGRLASSITGAGASGIVSTNVTYGLNAAEQKLTTGEVDINGKQYLKDLLWNTGSSMVGGAIGGKFGQWQNATSNSTTRFGLIGAEELTSISADISITYARDGKITTEGLLQTFQASFTGRMQAHFAHQQISGPKNELADNINKQELQVRVNSDLPKAQQALKNQIDTTLAEGHEKLTNTLNNIAGSESNEVIQSKIDQLKEAIKFSEKSSNIPDAKKLIDEQINDQLSELNHILARRANLSSTDSSVTKGLHDIINSQNIKPEASERFNAIAQHVDQGIKLLQQGLYEEAQAHLNNQTKAKELGINLENKFLDAKNLDTQQAVTYTIDFSAFGSKHRNNNINLVNLNFHGQKNDFAQNSPNEYNRLQQNQALVHLEEWLHRIQDLTVEGSITDKYSYHHELDVAHAIETLGIKLSPEFLDRYGRNVLLEDRGISTTQNLNPEIQAQTKVRVEPNGSRSITVDLREGLIEAAKQGDIIAQKTILEETVAHARENPIDPLVKQADRSYKAMSTDQYHALRARQELAMRSVAEAKFAQAQGSSVSATKQDSKVVLAEMNQAIKKGDFTRALELAEAKGVGETYKKQFDTDYEYNSKRNRETDALEQTSFAKKSLEIIKLGETDIIRNGELDKQHLTTLDQESGLSETVLREAGIETIRFGEYGNGISIPFKNINGEVTGFQIRLDNNTLANLNSLPKDQLPKGLRMASDLVSKYQEIGNIREAPYYAKGFDPNSTDPIFLTEGAKKAIKISDSLDANSQVVGLNGAGNLKVFIDEMGTLLQGRKIYLAVDGDTATNPKVKAAQIDAIDQLTKAGADVRTIDVPLNKNNPKESGIDELLVSLQNEHNIDSHTAMRLLINNAESQGPIKNLDELKRKVELWQKEQISSERDFKETLAEPIKRKDFAEDLENILNPNSDPQKPIDDFLKKVSGLGEEFLKSIESDLNQIKLIAQKVKSNSNDPTQLDIKTNKALIDELRFKALIIQKKFNHEFSTRLQEAVDESSRSLIALSKTEDYNKIKDKITQLQQEITSYKKDDHVQKAVVIKEMQNLRTRVISIEEQATKPIDELLRSVGQELRPEDLSLISEASTAREVKSQINKLNILSQSGCKETRATVAKIKAELEVIEVYKVKQESRDTNTEIENKILDIARDASENQTQLVSARTHQSLMKLLDTNSVLIKNLKAKSTEIGYNFDAEIKNFVDNLHTIREVSGVTKLIDSIDRQLASQKGRSKEELNPKALFGLLREASYSSQHIKNGFEITEISAGNSLNHKPVVLNFKGEDVFKDINVESRNKLIDSLISQGLASSDIDKTQRFVPLDLRRSGSNSDERLLAMDSYTGELVNLKDLKPLDHILFETREDTRHFSPVEIDSLIHGSMVNNSGRLSNLVEYKLDLETFIDKNLIRSGLAWGQEGKKPSFNDEPFLSGELLQIEKQLLIAKHFNANISVAMDLNAIKTIDGRINEDSKQLIEAKRIFNYLELKYGLKVGERISIYDSNGVDRTSYFR